MNTRGGSWRTKKGYQKSAKICCQKSGLKFSGGPNLLSLFIQVTAADDFCSFFAQKWAKIICCCHLDEKWQQVWTTRKLAVTFLAADFCRFLITFFGPLWNYLSCLLVPWIHPNSTEFQSLFDGANYMVHWPLTYYMFALVEERATRSSNHPNSTEQPRIL